MENMKIIIRKMRAKMLRSEATLSITITNLAVDRNILRK